MRRLIQSMTPGNAPQRPREQPILTVPEVGHIPIAHQIRWFAGQQTVLRAWVEYHAALNEAHAVTLAELSRLAGEYRTAEKNHRVLARQSTARDRGVLRAARGTGREITEEHLSVARRDVRDLRDQIIDLCRPASYDFHPLEMIRAARDSIRAATRENANSIRAYENRIKDHGKRITSLDKLQHLPPAPKRMRRRTAPPSPLRRRTGWMRTVRPR